MFHKQTKEFAKEQEHHSILFTALFPTAFCNTISFCKLTEEPIIKEDLQNKQRLVSTSL